MYLGNYLRVVGIIAVLLFGTIFSFGIKDYQLSVVPFVCMVNTNDPLNGYDHNKVTVKKADFKKIHKGGKSYVRVPKKFEDGSKDKYYIPEGQEDGFSLITNVVSSSDEEVFYMCVQVDESCEKQVAYLRNGKIKLIDAYFSNIEKINLLEDGSVALIYGVDGFMEPTQLYYHRPGQFARLDLPLLENEELKSSESFLKNEGNKFYVETTGRYGKDKPSFHVVAFPGIRKILAGINMVSCSDDLSVIITSTGTIHKNKNMIHLAVEDSTVRVLDPSCLSRDGSKVVICVENIVTEEKYIAIYDIDKGRHYRLGTCAEGDQPVPSQFSSDGKSLLGSINNNSRVSPVSWSSKGALRIPNEVYSEAGSMNIRDVPIYSLIAGSNDSKVVICHELDNGTFFILNPFDNQLMSVGIKFDSLFATHISESGDFAFGNEIVSSTGVCWKFRFLRKEYINNIPYDDFVRYEFKRLEEKSYIKGIVADGSLVFGELDSKPAIWIRVGNDYRSVLIEKILADTGVKASGWEIQEIVQVSKDKGTIVFNGKFHEVYACGELFIGNYIEDME